MCLIIRLRYVHVPVSPSAVNDGVTNEERDVRIHEQRALIRWLGCAAIIAGNINCVAGPLGILWGYRDVRVFSGHINCPWGCCAVHIIL